MPYREADDLNKYLFHEGTAISAYEYMGAHAATHNGVDGYMFRVWAPRAQAVSVVGDFNSWDQAAHPMEKITDGIWERFVPGGQTYAPPVSSIPSTAMPGGTRHGAKSATDSPSTPRR